MKIAYRKASAQDTSGIHTVETSCFPIPWSLESIQYDICQNPIAMYVVAADSDKIIGFCGAHLIFDEGHITNVAVLPEYRGKGVGKSLLKKLFALTKDSTDQFTLEVRETNSTAIRLYHRLGFTAAGTRPEYYPDTREDALIMWRRETDASKII